MPEIVIDGPSLGLAFFLLLAARVSGIPTPVDVIAAASIDPSGALGPVDGLSLKLEAVSQLAPGIRKVVVCADQEDEARRATSGRLEICGCRLAAQAAEVLMGEALVSNLIQQPPDQRMGVIASLFRLAVRGRSQMIDWSPVERAADHARASWVDLDERARYTLEFVRAVAARHQGNRGSLGLPPERWLDSFPLQLRLRIVASLVQQCADTGSPEMAGTLALAEPLVANDMRAASPAELLLAGAMGRLESLTARPERALDRQEQLARTQLEAMNFEDVSHPLCEWLRLAAALGNRQRFEEAVHFADEAAAVGAMGPGSESFLQLAKARGLVLLGCVSGPEPGNALQRLATNHEVPDHVRRSAARWRVALLRRFGGTPSEIANARQQLADACPGHEPDGQVFLALAELDAAINTGGPATLDDAIAKVRAAQPALAQQLLDAATEGQATYLARFYPY